MTAHLAIVDDRCFHGREQVLDDAIEQWKVSRGQLCNVHVLHTHQQDLMAETQRQTRSVLLKSLVHLKGKDRTMRWVLQSLHSLGSHSSSRGSSNCLKFPCKLQKVAIIYLCTELKYTHSKEIKEGSVHARSEQEEEDMGTSLK